MGQGNKSMLVARREACLSLTVSGLCLVLLLVLATKAPAEVPTHLFDATRSVTGTCTVSTLDPVADPGCPGSHAPEQLISPRVVAVDSNGDQFVLNGSFEEEKIDVFDDTGHWLAAVTKQGLMDTLSASDPKFENLKRALVSDIAVDSAGYLYVAAAVVTETEESLDLVLRYTPNVDPPSGGLTYESPAVVFAEHGAAMSIALDNEDRLYLDFGPKIDVYKSAADGNGLLRQGIGAGVLNNSVNLAIGPGGDIYATGVKPGASPIASSAEPFVSEIFVFDESGTLLEEVDGSNGPNCAPVGGVSECGFSSNFGQLDIAVDQATEDIYVSDKLSNAVYQFERESGTGEYVFLSKTTHSFQNFSFQGIALGQAGAGSSAGYLFVNSQSSGIGHLYAFRPRPEVDPPTIAGQRVSGLSTDEALLEAEVDPNSGPTEYSFELVDEETYLEDIDALGAGHGFDHAERVPQPAASLSAGDEAITVRQAVTGLAPGTVYRFRAVAENCDPTEPDRPCATKGEGSGGIGPDASFATYPAAAPSGPCANAAFRIGFSASLPHCRAYELVTPPDTNGLPPVAFTIGTGTTGWSNPLAAPSGDSLLFVTKGGALPGFGGTGGLNTDGYRARRDPSSGWHTEAAGPSGVQSQAPTPGSFSPDQNYWVWSTFPSDEGSLGPNANVIRRPDGGFEPVGVGSLSPGGDPKALPRWISTGASHIVFSSTARLEENAPATGVTAIYDRTPGGPTRLVSLLPGEVTPAGDAIYQGSSADGTAVAFKVGAAMYVRLGNAITREVTGAAATFAGLSDDGRWLFYLQNGNLFAFDTTSGQLSQIGTGGESTAVNVSADGGRVYFVSRQQLVAQKGQTGKDNLYVWDGSSKAVNFIAVLDHLDVTGEQVGQATTGGLGLWTSDVVSPDQGQFRGSANDPSRTTADGRVFVFESRANLTRQSQAGHREVYRYDASTGSLICVSCNPSLAPPVGHSKLTSLFEEGGPINAMAEIANLSSDGRRVFFESRASLVPSDTNGAVDVYEWSAEEAGGCARPVGCVALLSSGQGTFDSHLYAVTPDGRDVFIWTSDMLAPRDRDGTPSIYDAREGGGFSEVQDRPCEGEACRGAASAAPNVSAAASTTVLGSAPKRHKCRPPRRVLRKAGKTHCVKKVKHHRRRPGKHHNGGKGQR
jgi:hypothetical protein